jgi:hypothetical protein
MLSLATTEIHSRAKKIEMPEIYMCFMRMIQKKLMFLMSAEY